MAPEKKPSTGPVAETPRDPVTADPARPRPAAGLSRRGFLGGLGGAGAIAATGGLGLAGELLAPRAAAATPALGSAGIYKRRAAAAKMRRSAADSHAQGTMTRQASNGDEARYPDLRGQFGKTLPQNDLGEVDAGAYAALVAALASGDPADFDAIPLSAIADETLTNPQAALAFEMAGIDSWSTRMPPPPAFASAEAAAEMGEVYWQALTRDVPFRRYGTDPLIAAALSDLNAFAAPVGPTRGGRVTAETLFRGEMPGDLVGPYLSQFLWLPVQYGPSLIEQRYQVPAAGDDRMTGYAEWLAVQRGARTVDPLLFDPAPRYLHDNRSLGEWVHRDIPSQGFLYAALIMASFGPGALSPTNPYRAGSPNQQGFVSFGITTITDLVSKAGRIALTGAWYQKWAVHRRLRPEVFGGRIENQLGGKKDYGIHPDILGSDAVGRVYAANGTRLLPMAFPEGSPTHPSYPAGHAAIAGACATVLKALFDESFVVPEPVEATADGLDLDPWDGEPLTLGHEIDKLAANISIARDAAGVHYRSDGIKGMLVGEQQAIALLQDYSRTYNEAFDGFLLTRFDGQRILVARGEVLEI